MVLCVETCPTKIHIVEVLLPSTLEYDLIWKMCSNRYNSDEVTLEKGGFLIQYDWCLHKKEDIWRHTSTQGGCHMRIKTDHDDASTSQSGKIASQHQNREERKQILSHSIQSNQLVDTLILNSNFQNCEMLHFCCLKHSACECFFRKLLYI